MNCTVEGKEFDTAKAAHLGMVEGSCDYGKIENHLYRTPAGDFFFHRKFPPLYAVEIGKMEEITTVKDRHELVEWAEVHGDPVEAARLICGEDNGTTPEQDGARKGPNNDMVKIGERWVRVGCGALHDIEYKLILKYETLEVAMRVISDIAESMGDADEDRKALWGTCSLLEDVSGALSLLSEDISLMAEAMERAA